MVKLNLDKADCTGTDTSAHDECWDHLYLSASHGKAVPGTALDGDNGGGLFHGDVGPGSWAEFDFGEPVWVKEIRIWDRSGIARRGWPLDFFVHNGPAHQKQPGYASSALELLPRADIKDGSYSDPRTSPATTCAFQCDGPNNCAGHSVSDGDDFPAGTMVAADDNAHNWIVNCQGNTPKLGRFLTITVDGAYFNIHEMQVWGYRTS